MRLVLDTAVLVAAVRSDQGASRQLLRGALRRQFRLQLSVPLLIEYEAVLSRSEHLEASGLGAPDMQVLLDAIAAVADPVRLAFLWRPVTRDPDDDMVVETAMNGRADMIVTFNVRDIEAGARRFGIDVATPGSALKALESEQ